MDIRCFLIFELFLKDINIFNLFFLFYKFQTFFFVLVVKIPKKCIFIFIWNIKILLIHYTIIILVHYENALRFQKCFEKK